MRKTNLFQLFFIDCEVTAQETSRARDRPYCLFSLLLQFNFVGKLLGPRGNSMKRLQEETGAKMSILGKGSMRDKGKVRWLEMFLFLYINQHVHIHCLHNRHKEKQTIFSTIKFLLDFVYSASTIACTCYKLHSSPLQRFIPLKPIISKCNRADRARCEMMLCLKIITCNICHYTAEGLLFLAWLALYTFLSR